MGLLGVEETQEKIKEPISKKRPYCTWNVGGREYKLKLTTSGIITVENKIGMNLLSIISSTDNGNIPPLKIMLMITHQAMQKYEHGIKEDDVVELFDQYCDEGGSQTSFLTDIFIPIYNVSGFFSSAHADKMEKNLKEAKEQM